MTESHLKEETDLRQAVTRLANITKGKTGGEVKPGTLRRRGGKRTWKQLLKKLWQP